MLLAVVGCGHAGAPGEGVATTTPSASGSTFPPAPKSSTPPSFAPCAPAVTASPGVDSSGVQVGPDSWEVFIASNQWRGPADGSAIRWYVVWAGMSGEAATPPHVPAVWVDTTTLSSDRCTIDVAKVGEYFDRTAQGFLKIVTVDGDDVRMVDASGRPAGFDLSTDTFVSQW